MSNTLTAPIRQYMSRPVFSVGPTTLLSDVYQELRSAKVSSLAVVEADALVGVISRTDLLRAGTRNSEQGSENLEFASTEVGEIMTRDVSLVGPETEVAAASQLMCEGHFHRVFVGTNTELKGVFSTLDVMLAIGEGEAPEPISDFMSTPVEVVDVEATLASALRMLEERGITGLIAVENDWPVGVFTQRDALAARNLADDTPVEEAMDPALICMPVTTKMRRAAQQALRMRVRRIVASESRHMRGVLSGLDFARYAASAR